MIRRHHSEPGFTLLEVLAATTIFAMVMTVLISTSSTAVHHIGVSARRLEANLVADEILVDLELQMKLGIAPEVDESESTRDQYAIRVLRTDLFQDPGPTDSVDTGSSIASMLGSELPEVAKHLKQYDIEVSWFEQNGPQRVTRTTFAFDWQSAAIEFSELFRSGSGIGNGADQPGGGSGDESENGGIQGARRGDPKSRGIFSPPRPARKFGHNARLEHFRRLREAQEEN
jgi:prepilin-type N-terminal cleavage/methylation domain-containing protein